jgi:hypothetical protein
MQVQVKSIRKSVLPGGFTVIEYPDCDKLISPFGPKAVEM